MTTTNDYAQSIRQWYDNAIQFLHYFIVLRDSGCQRIAYPLHFGVDDEITPEQIEKQRAGIEQCRIAIADILNTSVERNIVERSKLATQYKVQFSERLVDANYHLRDFVIDGYEAGPSAWFTLEQLAGRMRHWARDLEPLWNDERGMIAGSRQAIALANMRDACPYTDAIGNAIISRLRLERSFLLSEQARTTDRPAAATPLKPATNGEKNTLKTAKVKTLERFLNDAEIMRQYKSWKERHPKDTIEQFATRNSIEEITAVQERFHKRTSQGWTIKNVTQSLKTKDK